MAVIKTKKTQTMSYKRKDGTVVKKTPPRIKEVRKKRPKMTTKEELMVYLEANETLGIELPFVQEAWDKAWERYLEDKDKPQTFQKIVSTKNGIEKVKNVPITVVKNPVSYYFQLMSFKGYKDKGLNLLDKVLPPPELLDSETEEIESDFDKNFKQESTFVGGNWLGAWIQTFPESECLFLKQRYSDYYNQYEINDGADKTVLMNLLSIEIQLYRINLRVSRGHYTNVIDIEKLNKQMISLLEAQKWTKKQRNEKDEYGTNRFTVWLDQMMKKGGFKPNKTEYDQDQIDRLIEVFMTSMREVTL